MTFSGILLIWSSIFTRVSFELIGLAEACKIIKFPLIISFVFFAIFTCQYGHQYGAAISKKSPKAEKSSSSPNTHTHSTHTVAGRQKGKKWRFENGQKRREGIDRAEKTETRSENAVVLTSTSPAVIAITFSSSKYDFSLLLLFRSKRFACVVTGQAFALLFFLYLDVFFSLPQSNVLWNRLHYGLFRYLFFFLPSIFTHSH